VSGGNLSLPDVFLFGPGPGRGRQKRCFPEFFATFVGVSFQKANISVFSETELTGQSPGGIVGIEFALLAPFNINRKFGHDESSSVERCYQYSHYSYFVNVSAIICSRLALNMKLGEIKKARLSLFQKCYFNPESPDSAALVLVCAAVFGASFFAGAQAMGGYNKKVAELMRPGKVLAAEEKKEEAVSDEMGLEESGAPENKKISETMSGAAGAVKNMAVKRAIAKRAAQEKAALNARIRSGPVLSGPTDKLANGLRVCPLKNDHPQRGGAVHTDEDCCPDYNETPNPRCAYSPAQRAIMK
jgi:hypothetical protein